MLGFRVEGLGLGFRVYGSGFRVGVQGSGFIPRFGDFQKLGLRVYRVWSPEVENQLERTW